MAKNQTPTAADEQELDSFLDQDFMDQDLERKVAPNGEYKLAFIDVFFSDDNEDERKHRDSNGNLYCNPLYQVTDGNFPVGDIAGPERVKTFTDYFTIPEIGRHSLAQIQDYLAPVQKMLKVLNVDPGMSIREMVDDKLRFLKRVAENRYEGWAIVKKKETEAYGEQNRLKEWTRPA